MSSSAIAPASRALPSAANPSAASAKARFWDRIAPKYATDPIADLAGYEATLQRVQGLLSLQHDVLEIGCGTGTTALRLAHRVRRLHATDVSSQMVAIAQEKLAATPVAQLDFAVLDAAGAAQQAPQAYDVVLAFNVLHLLPDLDGGLDAVWQALRPGGFFISKTPCVAEMNPLIPWVALPLARALGLAPPVHCFQGPTLEAAIARHGFEVLAVERHATKGRDVRPYIVARKPHQAATVADPAPAPR